MELLNFDNLQIYCSVYEYIDSNMYVIFEQENAIIIDPHYNAKLAQMLEEKQIENIEILLTHEHPDHISGLPWLKENFNTQIICTNACAAAISDEKATRPLLLTFVLEEKDSINNTNLLEKFQKSYKTFAIDADITFENEYSYKTAEHFFEFYRKPGHSKGSCCIMLDKQYIFTGDLLMKDNPTITRFPGGKTKDFQTITIPFLHTLNKEITVLPGHGGKFQLKEKMIEGHLNVAIR